MKIQHCFGFSVYLLAEQPAIFLASGPIFRLEGLGGKVWAVYDDEDGDRLG